MSATTQKRTDREFTELDYTYTESKLIATFEQDGHKFRGFAYLDKNLFWNEARNCALMSVNDDFMTWTQRKGIIVNENSYKCKSCKMMLIASRFRLDDMGTRYTDCRSCYSKAENKKLKEKLRQKKLKLLNGVATKNS
jgi:hypothetical protein